MRAVRCSLVENVIAFVKVGLLCAQDKVTKELECIEVGPCLMPELC